MPILQATVNAARTTACLGYSIHVAFSSMRVGPGCLPRGLNVTLSLCTLYDAEQVLSCFCMQAYMSSQSETSPCSGQLANASIDIDSSWPHNRHRTLHITGWYPIAKTLAVLIGLLYGIDIHPCNSAASHHNLAYSGCLLVPLVACHENGQAVDTLEKRRPACMHIRMSCAVHHRFLPGQYKLGHL